MFFQNFEPKKWKLFESTQLNYDVRVMGRFTRNILQWNENDIKSSQTTNGDYWEPSLRLPREQIEIRL